MTRSRSYKWWVVVMLWFICFFNYADRQSIYSVFPKLKEEFGFSTVQLGLIGSAFMWVYAAGAPLAGFMGDRLRRKDLILGGCLFWSFVTIMTGWCAKLWQFTTVRALEGFGETFYFPASMSLVSDYHDQRTRSRALSFHQSSVYLGSILGSWLGAWFAERHGWRLGFYFFGGSGMVLALVLYRFLREPRRGEAEIASGAGAPLPSEIVEKLSVGETLGVIFRTPAVPLLMLAFVGANLVAMIFLTWTPTFLVEKFHFKLTNAGLSGAVFINAASAISVPVAGMLADWFTRRFAGGRMLVQALGLLAGASFVFLVGRTSSINMLLLAMTGFGVCKGFYDSGIFASLYDVIEPRARSSAAGLMNTVGWSGGALGSMFVGFASKYGGKPTEVENMGDAIAFGGVIYLVAAVLVTAAMLVIISRSRTRAVIIASIAILGVTLTLPSAGAAENTTERWGVFEAAWQGPTNGNPFADVALTATFTQSNTSHEVTGFYDGDGVYRVRFMPELTGEWQYVTRSNRPELDGQSGKFLVGPPSAGNHGPVSVHATFHFAYADGTPYFELGTTCYSWTHRSDAQEDQTLRTLAGAPFNKIRMCVFPQDHAEKDQRFFPFEGRPPRGWDTTRFNPAFFRHLEQRVRQLRDLGIEADLILFHPYGKTWAFSSMDAASDDRYLRYLVARLASFRNVWWSLANEYDFIHDKHESDWDRLFQIVQQTDPYAHLRSIHNGTLIYNHTLPWVTHASIQNGAAVLDPERAMLYRDVYRKPVVFDEVKYEGDIEKRWGQLSSEELVFRFWNGLVSGSYVGHGEIFQSTPDPWLAGGGELHGQSVPRLAFLRKIMEAGPADGINPIDKWQDRHTAGKAGEYYLIYFGRETPKSWPFLLYKEGLKDGLSYRVEVLDTWNMTIRPVDVIFTAKRRDAYYFEDVEKKSVALPGRPYMALRIQSKK